MTRTDDLGRPLLTFHGPVKIYERRNHDAQLEYIVTPLDDAAALEAMADVRVRESWYAGIDAALRAAERLSVDEHPLPLGQLRARLAALRHPRDKRDE